MSRGGGPPVPMFPLGTVLFPNLLLPLRIFEARYRRMMRDCLAGDAVLIAPISAPIPC